MGWDSALDLASDSDSLSARVPVSDCRLVLVLVLAWGSALAPELPSAQELVSGSAPVWASVSDSDLAFDSASEFPGLAELVGPESRSGLASSSEWLRV